MWCAGWLYVPVMLHVRCTIHRDVLRTNRSLHASLRSARCAKCSSASVVLKITKTRTGTREESRKSFRATRALHSTRLSQAGRISVTTKTLRKHAPDSRAHRAIANAARLHPDDTFCAIWSENSRRSSNPRRGCTCLYQLCVSVDFASDTNAYAVICEVRGLRHSSYSTIRSHGAKSARCALSLFWRVCSLRRAGCDSCCALSALILYRERAVVYAVRAAIHAARLARLSSIERERSALI